MENHIFILNKKPMANKTFGILIFFLTLTSINIQSLELTGFGKLSVTNYSPATYGGNKQNWNISVGNNGLVYFANGPLLEGGSGYWKTFHLPNDNFIRSVWATDDGRILVGGSEEIGLFEKSPIPGKMKYTSLMDRLDSAYYNFGSIWQIFKGKGSYYLRAGKALFEYKQDTIKPIIHSEIIEYSTLFNDTLYILVADKGLGAYTNDSFQILPYGKFFSDTKIIEIASSTNGEKLIFTDDRGTFIVRNNTIEPYELFNQKQIIESQISAVKLLENKYYAIGTVKNGLYILDVSGNVIQHLDNKSGLQNNTIISMYKDATNNLWLGLDYGISYVHLNSCLTMVNPEFEIGTGYVSTFFKGKLYLGSNQGLFYTEWKPGDKKYGEHYTFLPVKNSSGQVWNLQVFNGELFCGHHKGLFKINDDVAIVQSSVEGSWQMEQLLNEKGYFIQSTYRGFYLLKFDDKMNLLSYSQIPGLPASRSFIQEENGYIWTTNNGKNLYRFKINTQTSKTSELIDFKDFTDSNFEYLRILGNKEKIFFSAKNELYTFDENNAAFKKNDYYSKVFENSGTLFDFFKDDYERIWFVASNEIGYFSFNFGQQQKVIYPFNSIRNSYTNIFGKINIINKENILLPVDQGFYYYNASCSEESKKEYKAYIVNIHTNSENIAEIDESAKPTYKYTKNAIEFTITSDMTDSRGNVYYRFKLEGYDDEWSEWSTKNTKEYNNLYEGNYKFTAVSRNENGIISNSDSFEFAIKPPFLRSLAAFGIYIIAIILLLILSHKLRKRQLEIEKRKIEEQKQLEIENKKRKYQEERLRSQQQITSLENEKLQQNLLHKSKELSNSMINILHKNEIFLNLKSEMQKLYLEKDLKKRDTNIKKLIRVIDSEISTKQDLEVFDTNFNAVHEEFINKLKESYPELNQNDHRLCTFIKMNKSTKEIATFLNMSIRGVETSRYRLRKKMNLDSNDNLYDVILSI